MGASRDFPIDDHEFAECPCGSCKYCAICREQECFHEPSVDDFYAKLKGLLPPQSAETIPSKTVFALQQPDLTRMSAESFVRYMKALPRDEQMLIDMCYVFGKMLAGQLESRLHEVTRLNDQLMFSSNKPIFKEIR